MDNFKNIDGTKIVLFSLEEPRYALYLSDVVKVERAAEITPLPRAPQQVSGVINFHGEIIPVIDLRTLFRLPHREMRLEDHFIVARTSQRLVVLAVDSVNGVYEVERHHTIDTLESFPFTEYLSGVTAVEQGIALITDLEKFLSLDEERVLAAALAGGEE